MKKINLAFGYWIIILIISSPPLGSLAIFFIPFMVLIVLRWIVKKNSYLCFLSWVIHILSVLYILYSMILIIMLSVYATIILIPIVVLNFWSSLYILSKSYSDKTLY